MTRISLALLATLFLAGSALAEFTQAQRDAIKADVLADPVLSVLPPSSDAVNKIISAYAGQPAQACVVWRTELPVEDVMRNGMDWARVDNLSVGKARIWDWMGRLGTLNCSQPNIRAGIDAVWVGTAADLAVRAAVYAHCKKTANRLETLLATGECSDASPATMTYEGGMSYWEVLQIMGW